MGYRRALFRVWIGAFLACAVTFLLLGGIFVFHLPPFQVPDEPAHWNTAVHQAKLLLGEPRKHCGAEYAFQAALGFDNLIFRPDQKVTTGQFDALRRSPEVGCASPTVRAGYASILGYPQVALAKLIVTEEQRSGSQALLAFYLSRILSGLMLLLPMARLLYVVMTERMVFPGVLTAFLIFLSPIGVQQSFAVSSDVALNAFVLWQISLLVLGRRAKTLDWVCYAFFGVVAAAAKPIMMPISALFALSILVPVFLRYRREGGLAWAPHKKMGILIATLVTVIAASALLLFDHDTPDHIFEGVNPRGQMAYVLSHPLSTLSLFIRDSAAFFSLDTLKSPLGWLDTGVPDPARFSYQILLFFVLILEGLLAICGLSACRRDGQVRGDDRYEGLVSGILVIFGSFVMVGLIAFALYLGHTKVGSATLAGLQPRYFLAPMAIIIASLLGPSSFMLSGDQPDRDTAVFRMVPNVIVTLVVFVGAFYITAVGLGLSYRYW